MILQLTTKRRHKGMAGNSGTAKGSAKGSKSVGGRSQNGSHDDIPEPIKKGYKTANKDAQIDAMAQNAHLSKEDAQRAYTAIRNFTEADYKLIRAVEKNDPNYLKHHSPDQIAEAKNKIEAINSYITKAPAYKGEIYRGVSFPDAQSQADFLRRFGSSPLNAMSSFASKIESTHFYTGNGSEFSIILKVNNKSGVSVRNISHYPQDNEVLVPKGTKYKMTGKTSKLGNSVIVELEEI